MNIISSIDAEFRRYKSLGDGAMAQLADAELSQAGPHGGHSVTTLAWHISRNLKSRFTDFLTSDGEKPWRDRESEFEARRVSRAELLATWEDGWTAVLGALQGLGDAQLGKTITIRNIPLTVHESLHRSVAHTCYHVGQIVYIAKGLRGGAWQYLSIPPGKSAEYNRNPTGETADAHAAAIRRLTERR